MTFTAYTREELTNEAYHSETDHISGSSLVEIIQGSPAKWKFKQRNSDSKALKFGTLSHTCILEGDMFDKEYLRATDLDAIEGLITSQAGLSAALKKVGVAGTSGKGYSELVEMMYRSGEYWDVKWLIEQQESARALIEGKELVSAADYDKVVAMREVLCNIPAYSAIVNSETAQKELSIFGEILGVGVKIRIDHVDVVDGVVCITDLKTTASASPQEFGRLAFKHGYLAKMALQHDVFVRAFNEKRKTKVSLLAIEKEEPYLPMLYNITEEQLKVGRRMYLEALATYKKCKENDEWPGYAMGATEIDLDVPEWDMRKYRDEI